uniref:Large ribosomal subunit protein uL2m n=1 Tax=Tydemania expeditionis TaxID=325645 RepID=A0A0D6E295_TYDEX|nr:50S ribosomal protein L2 [Tydemania expeditionis]CEO91120.1 50S ribosomal protein L2 [Tydemania expeditionis]
MTQIKKIKYRYHRKRGRNNQGKITSQHRGGGHARLYRQIEFQKMKINKIGHVQTIEYDPNRSGQIVKIIYEDGTQQYQLSSSDCEIGESIIASPKATLKSGNTLPLKNIPLGLNVYNIESAPGRGGKFVRAAGTTALLMAKFGSWVTLRLPSNEVRLFSANCWATVGQVSNVNHLNQCLQKAGKSRWLGIRPRVRGSAKNPVDHPHGGGEGRGPIGRKCPVTPWGKPTLGKLTRRPKKYSDPLILRRK